MNSEMKEKSRISLQIELSALLFLLLLIWGYSIYYGDINAAFKGRVSVRYDEPAIDHGSISKAVDGFYENDPQSSNIPSISLWNLKRDVVIADEDGMNEAKVDLIRMNGDMSSVAKEDLLCGNLVLNGDLRGCVIDKNAAYELYGSYNVLGKTIVLDNKSYNIYGILDTASNRMLIQEDNPSEKYAYLEFCYPMDGKSTKNRLMNDLGTITENFLLQYGFPESRAIIDKDFAVDVMKMVYGLPGCFILLFIIIDMIKIHKRARKVPLIHAASLPVIILISVLLGQMAGIRFSFPERFIPTRWSDFDFWSRQADEFRHNISDLFSIMPVSCDMIFKEYCSKCIITSVLAIILCILLHCKWRRYLYIDVINGINIWVICLCVLMITFLSMYTLYRFNMAITPARGYMTIFLGDIFASLFTNWMDTYLSRFECLVETQLR
jgi:hypothetical protein